MPIEYEDYRRHYDSQLVEQDEHHGSMINRFGEEEQQQGHEYISITAEDESIQVNGDVGLQQGMLSRRNTYNCAIASGRGRQINGNVDTAVFLQLFKA
jgi:hypothetical protein